jgi:hypothetical protein
MSDGNLIPEGPGTQGLDERIDGGLRDHAGLKGRLSVKAYVGLFFCLMSATMLAWLFLLGWILWRFFF